jgi:hypothetical protein
MTSTAENKTVVDEFIQALFTKGGLLAVDRYLADDFPGRKACRYREQP